MKISFAKPPVPETGIVVVMATEGPVLTASGQALDKRLKGALKRALKASPRFKGKAEQMISLLAPADSRIEQVVVVGLGKAEEIAALGVQKAGGETFAALGARGLTAASWLADSIEGCPLPAAEIGAEAALGARLRSYRFDKYRTKEEADKKPSLKTLKIICEAASQARDAFQKRDKVADGVFLTRDLVSEPANVMYPETIAEQAQALTELGVDVEVLTQEQMEKLGMGALLGVAQGSHREPKLVVMQWQGLPNGGKSRAKSAPIAFVGKGVTFDTGGISLKPAAGMEEMKGDMAGAAVVIGLMKALAGRNARVHAVGVIGLVENMPSGTAQRPGDVVKSMSGQTIEVLNTDAEGRLVLADALWYTQERFKPRAMVDLATLTGAMVIALGHEKAGLFASDDDLATQLAAAGEAAGESLWRFPLGPEYDKLIDSDIADMQNIGANRGAGSITAAQFLKRFVKDVPWAHLDIAGVAWLKKDAPVRPKGASGFGVRLLDRLVADYFEQS